MTNFKFQGKTYRIVPDVLGELVAGCRKCAFDGNDELCSGVDQADVLKHHCTEPGHFHHYEEVTCSGTA